jgi:hypothetical protein
MVHCIRGFGDALNEGDSVGKLSELVRLHDGATLLAPSR